MFSDFASVLGKMQTRNPFEMWRELINHAENGGKRQRRHEISKDEKKKLMRLNENDKMLILMVGKPSRKTRVAAKVKSYLAWLGYKVDLIISSQFRFKKVGAVQPDFFDPANQLAAAQKQAYNDEGLENAIDLLKGSSDVVILDSAHHTKEVSQFIENQS